MINKINKNQNFYKNPFYVFVASLALLTLYMLFANLVELREWLISTGIFGIDCDSCQPQAWLSMLITLVPIALGALGIGYATALALYKEKIAVRAAVGTVVAVVSFIFCYYAFGVLNFAFNF